MRGAVIRGLWGDEGHRRHNTGPPKAFRGIREEVRRSVEAGERTDRVYVWGAENFHFCLDLGLPAELVDARPYGSPKLRTARGPRYGGMVLWGVNHMWHKWPCILLGLTEFEEIVCVDWDLRQIKEVDDRWFARQASYGVPFRAKLAWQWNTRWGAGWREREYGLPIETARDVPYGGCLWLGDTEFAEACRNWSERVPSWMQQQCLAKALDESRGKTWIGREGYFRLKYEADFVRIKNQIGKSNDDSIVWEIARERRKI